MSSTPCHFVPSGEDVAYALIDIAIDAAECRQTRPVLPRLFNDPDTAAASRARAAMMQMKKIDIAALEAAFHSA